MKNLWEQLPTESRKAFAVFIAFRDMGFQRSCHKVAKKLSMSISSVLELSKRHNWPERVRAWDAHVDQEIQKDQLEAIKIMKQRQISLALKAQKAAEKGLRQFIAQFNGTHIPPSAMKPDGLSKLLDTGCRLERLNRDEPEQNLEVSQINKFDNLSLEECQQLRMLIAKAEGIT